MSGGADDGMSWGDGFMQQLNKSKKKTGRNPRTSPHRHRGYGYIQSH